MQALRRVFLVLAAAACLTGCAISRPSRSPQALAAHRAEVVAYINQAREDLSRKIIDRALAEQASTHPSKGAGGQYVIDMLILSGGGDYGAFGAGVLKGWGTVTDPTMLRPQFDVVSGVSTGALIAPLAFVGTPEAYERAFFVYQNPRPEWTRLRGLLKSLITKASFVDNAWLKKEIKDAVDDSTIRDIARGHDENRVLLIGTTNVDLGLLVMWDAADIAHDIATGTVGRQRLDDVLLASSAIPAVFPPVEIDSDLYVDGGTTRNIAYSTDQDSPKSVLNIWRAEHAGHPLPRVRIWVIVNNQLSTAAQQVGLGWPAQMARSLDIVIRSSTIGSLKSLTTSMDALRKNEHVDIELRYISIPNAWRPPVEGSFKKETMVSLAQLGLELGKDPRNWKTDVPDPESPEQEGPVPPTPAQ